MKTFSLRQVLLIALVTAVTCTAAANFFMYIHPLATQAAPVGVTSPTVASDEQNNVEIYRTVSPGVVHITSTVAVRSFFGVFPQQGTGSGSIIDKEGHILTNYHVIRNARQLDVTLADKSSYRATIVGADPENDVAVIKIDAPASKLHVIPMGNSTDLAVGQKVLAIGNPFGLDRTLTTGVISGLDRPLQGEDGQLIEKVIQTDASINPGNSGGPLLDKFGRIIGINTAIYSPTGASVGIGFAVPIDTARQLIPELLTTGTVRHGYLGITTTPLTPDIARQFDLSGKEGMVVVAVQPGGPASVAGIRGTESENQIGDVIVSVDNQPMSDPGDLARTMGRHKPGDRVVLGIVRQGREQRVVVTLGERPTRLS